MNSSRCSRKASRRILSASVAALLAVTTTSAFAASAQWLLNPGSGDWTTATNWNPANVPGNNGDVATFGTSNTTAITLAQLINIDHLNFLAGASPFTITVINQPNMQLSGAGITNNSGIAQNFVVASSPGPGAGSGILFFNSSSAGTNTIFTQQGATAVGGAAGFVNFEDSSTAGAATFNNQPGAVSGAIAGQINFFNTANAGTATVNNFGTAVASTSSGGSVSFHDQSSGASATINNFGAGISGGKGGLIAMFDLSSMGNATIVNQATTFGVANGAFLDFRNASTGGTAHITNQGSAVNVAFSEGQTELEDSSSLGSAVVNNTGGSVAGGPGGLLNLQGNATAGNSTITDGGAQVAGGQAGTTQFKDHANGGTATIGVSVGTLANTVGGALFFTNQSSAGSAQVTIAGSAFSSSANAFAQFNNTATAGAATFNLLGATTSVAAGGAVSFFDQTDGGTAHFIVSPGAVAGANGGALTLQDNTSANSALIDLNGATVANAFGGRGLFAGNATAASATINVNGTAAGAFGTNTNGQLQFQATATAGTSTININGSTAAGGKPGGAVNFGDTTTAGSAIINVNGSTTNNGGQGTLDFFTNSTAGSAQIFNRSATGAGTGGGGVTNFHNNSSAGSAMITTEGGAVNFGLAELGFNDNSTAGNATIINKGDTANGGAGAEIVFTDHSSGGTSVITNQAAGAGADDGAFTNFIGSSTAGNAFITNEGSAAGGRFSAGQLYVMGAGLPTLGNAVVNNNGATAAGGSGGLLDLGSATAANSEITANGGQAAGAAGGEIDFNGGSTGGNASIVVNGGTGGALGGTLFFTQTADGGLANATVNGNGSMDISGLSTAGMSIGTITGSGKFFLGSKQLTFGGNNGPGDVSGVISDGGASGGVGGSLVKIGTGFLRLGGANTYTGATTVNGGLVVVDGTLASSSVTVNNTGSLGGTGTISGPVSIANGGTLAPGETIGSLSTGALSLTSGATLLYDLKNPGTVGGGVNDFVNVTGNLTLDGTLNINALAGFGIGTYRLINYSGALTDNVLNIGSASTAGYGYAINTATPGHVDLVVASSGQILFWNGSQTVGNGTVNGGTGTWNNATTNWTDAAGVSVGPWSSNQGIFAGSAGTVTLGANVAFTELDFHTDGYVINRDAGNAFSITPTGAAVIDVINGVTATINAPLTGAGSLTVTDLGTLVLAGANNYAGGTTVNAGTLQIGNAATGAITGPVLVTGIHTILLLNNADTTGVTTITNSVGAITRVNNNTSASTIQFTNNPSTAATSGAGGQTIFNGSATAATATIINVGGDLATTGTGGNTEFHGTSTAANATIINDGSTAVGAFGGDTTFGSGTSGGSANITNNPGTISGAIGGATNFASGSNPNNATVTDVGAAVVTAAGSIQPQGGQTFLNANNVAVNAHITNQGGSVNGADGGTVVILSGRLGGFTVTNQAGTVSGAHGGTVNGFDILPGGSGTIINQGASVAGAGAGATSLGENDTAILIITNTGASVSGGAGGTSDFSDNSNLATSTITSNGGSGVGANGGILTIHDTSTAANATIITNGGTAGGNGAQTFFLDTSDGGTATAITGGNGQFDISKLSSAGMSIGSIAGNGNYLLGSKQLTVGGNNNPTMVNGAIADGGAGGGIGGSIVKTGSGTFTMGGANTYTGATTLNQGIIKAGSALGFSSASAFKVNTGTTLDLNGFSDTIGSLADGGGGGGTVTNTGGTSSVLTIGANNTNSTFTGTIQNGVSPLAITKTGVGTLKLGGVNSYTGATIVNQGVLQAGSTSSFGTNSAVQVSSGATLDLNGFSNSIGSLADGTGGGTVDNLAAGVATLTVGGNSANSTFSGVIRNANGTLSLVKTGGGNLNLTGASTYAGTTSINGGILRVNGSLTGTSVAVNNGGTLGGSGTISGPVTVNSGGILAPGNSPGTITVGTLTLNAGSIENYELDTPNVVGGGVNDLTEVNGNLTLNGGTLNITGLANFGVGTYRLFDYTGALTGSTLTLGTIPAGFNPVDFTIQTSVAHQVNLIVSVAPPTQYWDGPNMVANNVVDGGTSTWNAANTNWTNSTGSANTTWQSAVAVFNAGAGTATLGSNITATQIQFLTGAGAYTISVPASLSLTITGFGVTNTSASTQNFSLGVTGPNAGSMIFNNGATAGTSNVAYTLAGGALPGNFGGHLTFNNTATAGSATFHLLGGGFIALGGLVDFNNTSTAGTGTFNLDGGAADSATGGFISFHNNSTAAGGQFTLAGGAVTDAQGAEIDFKDSSTAENALLTANGAALASTFGAFVTFNDTATAGNATLIANGGSNGGTGGEFTFNQNSTGGTATVKVFGNGEMDISNHNAPGITVGSIEGDGNIFLGANNLTTGANSNSTTFSGVLQDGGFNGGTGGSLTKIGTSTLNLSGVNTYTGATTVNGGTLAVNGSLAAASAVTVNNNATLAGTGTAAGPVTLASGGILAPGNGGAGTFHTGALTTNSGSKLNYELATPNVVGGVNDLTEVTGDLTLGGGTLNITALPGFGIGTYRILDYTNNLLGSTLTIGTAPLGYLYTVDTSIAHQVNLDVAGGGPLPIAYWNGSTLVPDGTVHGGPGTWDSSSTNWTDANGNLFGSWGGQVGIFEGAPGTINLGSNVNFTSLEFVTNGHVIHGGVFSLTGVGPVAIITDAGVGATIDATIFAPGGVTKLGTGSLFLDGSLFGNLQVLQGLLGGHGSILGNLFNAAIVSPGHSPGTLHVSGNYTQTSTGLLKIEIGGRGISEHDLLTVGGIADLNGTLQLVRLDKFKLKRHQSVTFLTAAGGVRGEFAHVISDFTSETILQPTVVYHQDSVALEAVQGLFASLDGLTFNQKAVAHALDSAASDHRADAIFGYLDSRKLDKLPGDFDKIAPEELTSIFTIGVSLANVQSGNIQRRNDDIRNGTGGFNAAGLAINGYGPSFSGTFRTGVAGPNGAEIRDDGKEVKETKEVVPAESRWGVFLSGTGEWVSVGNTDNARGYDLSSGGFTLGIDYKVTPNFAIGLAAGYTGTSADLVDRGRVYVNGGKIGLYATFFQNEQAAAAPTMSKDSSKDSSKEAPVPAASIAKRFYADMAVFGGYNSYDTRRSALQGEARGDTDGGEFNALFGMGYDFKKGNLTFGPTASFNYTYLGTGEFTEHGSLAPLNIHGGKGESLRTALGVKASYDWRVGGVFIKPEIRAAWQHEYGDAAYALDSTFANGAGHSFLVNGPQLGRDSVLVGAGFAIQFNERMSTYFYYDGELGRKNYQSSSVTGGFRYAF